MRSALGRGQLASSLNLLLPDAMATGNLTIVPNAVVRDITVDKNTGLVNGANFLDRHSRREMHAKAKVVVVGASCLESTRILLNSGIANSSGVLGHYLHDQFYITQSVQAVMPEVRNKTAPRGLCGRRRLHPAFSQSSDQGKRFPARLRVRFQRGRHAGREILPAVWQGARRTRSMRIAGPGSPAPAWAKCCRALRITFESIKM